MGFGRSLMFCAWYLLDRFLNGYEDSLNCAFIVYF